MVISLNNSVPKRLVGWVVPLLVAATLSGCGTSVSSIAANRLVGATGQEFTLDELEAIAANPDLDDDGKRSAFRDLGLEDERLIDALLGL